MESAYLEVKDAKGQRRVPLDGGPLTIGRNFTNLVVLEEQMASRFHCVIEKDDEGFQLRDLDSRNGTRVNGKPVKQASLASGDVVGIGKSELKLVIPASQGAQADVSPDDAMNQLASLVSEDSDSQYEREESAFEPAKTTDNPEKHLRDRADSLGDKHFGEWDMTLMNARGKIVQSEKGGDASEAVTIFRLVLLICFRSRATDIHVEPKNDDVHVRIRVDGTMVDVARIDKELGVKLLSMVKVLSDIDIAQKNIVQEGHFSARVPNAKGRKGPAERRVDYRVSFAPAMHGQKLVIRVLDEANAPLHIDELHLPQKAKQLIRKVSEQESGMILVCGPTGSGKTTTLYAVLRDIDVTQRNVVTIEDPVEIQLEGVTQIPVNEGQGNTFSALLRSVLRQDPDVILIGEIRDTETARVGVQAGMTGHLVFSTVHSRDAISGMFRLLDLGVEAYVVANGLHLVVAQRLVRRLCQHCKVPKTATPAQLKEMAAHGVAMTGAKKIFEPKGCKRCFGSGYFGRDALFEILMATPQLREVLLKTPTTQECKKALDAESFISLASSGYRMVADGLASFDEVEKTIA